MKIDCLCRAIRTTIIELSVIHSRTSRVYIILERDSVEGRCMQMSDKFCVMHLKYLSCVSLHIVESSSVIESLKRASHGKLKLANSCWQTQVGVCEQHKNSPKTHFYLMPTVCKHVCCLLLCCSHTPTWVCQHEFANLSLPCEGRFKEPFKVFILE